MKSMTELISWFQLEYPSLAKSMKLSNHHLEKRDVAGNASMVGILPSKGVPESLNPYHLESDIFTHTMMVCKQAENASYEVRIAALLHDIGKPSTRKVNAKNGRVSFYNHDAVGAFMALEILKREELGLTKNQQVHIFNLIALHTQIYKLRVEQLGQISSDDKFIEDLIELGEADHSGRFHTEGNAVIPSLGDIPPFYTLSSRKDTTKEVIVLCGLPASGKSRYSSDYIDKNIKECFFVSRDYCLLVEAGEVGSYTEAWNKADQSKVNTRLDKEFRKAKNYDKVIVDMTHMSKKSRRKSLSHFGPEYKKRCIVFLTDLQTLKLRNEARTGKVIDREVVDKMMRSFYPPTMEEFDEIEYIIGD